MEEPALLLPVQRIVGGIQVQDDQRRGLGLALQEQIDEQRFDRCRIVADLMVARRLRPAQFQPVQRRLARDRRTIGPPSFQLAVQDRHHWVVAQLIVVVQILVTQRNAEDALANQRADLMLDQLRAAVVGEAGSKPIHQANRPVRRSQQQRTRVRRYPPPIERCHHGATRNRCKFKQRRVTLCRHRGTPPLQKKSFSQKNFRRFGTPMHLLAVRYAG
jgi:hypothetical protein